MRYRSRFKIQDIRDINIRSFDKLPDGRNKNNKVGVDTIVNVVGTRRIILYGKLQGYTKIHVKDGRVYGRHPIDGKLDDISLCFISDKYPDIVYLTSDDLVTLKCMDMELCIDDREVQVDQSLLDLSNR